MSGVYDLERLGFFNIFISVCVLLGGGGGGDSECLGPVQRAEERRGPRLALQGAQMMRVIVANGAW